MPLTDIFQRSLGIKSFRPKTRNSSRDIDNHLFSSDHRVVQMRVSIVGRSADQEACEVCYCT
jgi:hypothetical protein